MGGVAAVPFGHLNAVWRAFLQGAGAFPEVWSFVEYEKTLSARTKIREGYVVVRNGVPASFVLTVWRRPEYET